MLPKSVLLKLKRAEQQTSELESAIHAWSTANLASGKSELRDGRLGFRLILQEFAQPAPLDEWGLCLGECVHNLRSSLDNLAFSLARVQRDPPERPRRIAFPIYSEGLDFKKSGMACIDQLPKDAAVLIERMQPYQRDGSAALGTPDRDALVLLQNLSNSDKHRVPTVVLLAPTEMGHSFAVEFRSDDEASANVPPDATVWGGPLEPGAVLIEYRTKHPIASVQGQFEGRAVVAMQLEGQTPPLVPTLRGLHHYVATVCAQFDSFFQEAR